MSKHTTPHSPLDPFLAQFLDSVRNRNDGFQPGHETTEIAARLDVPRAFINALFTSARTRGLLKPIYGRGSKVRWTLSPTGEELVDRVQAVQHHESDA